MRIKHVFSNALSVGQFWLKQSQDWGKNKCGNISFRDKVLYSYSTAIANIVKENVVLLSSDTYSTTTSGHQWLASRLASREKYKVYRVLHCLAETKEMHQRNIVHYENQLKRSFVQFYKAIYHYNSHFARNKDTYSEMVMYCTEFDMPVPAVQEYVLTTEKVNDFFTKRIKQHSDNFWKGSTNRERHFTRVKKYESALERTLFEEDKEPLVIDSITKNPEALKIMEAIALAKRLMK